MKKITLIRRLKTIRRLLNWMNADGAQFANDEVNRLIDKLDTRKKKRSRALRTTA